MNNSFDKNKLYFIAIILVIIGMIYFFKNTNSDIIMYEGMNNTKNDKSNKLNKVFQPCNQPPIFHYKQNRDLVNEKSCSSLNKISHKVSHKVPHKYSHKILKNMSFNDVDSKNISNWDVKYEPGANNTYGDTLWHEMSPRMILIDNCMHCDEYKADSKHVTPMGIADSFIIDHDNNIESGLMSIDKSLNSEILSPQLIPGYTKDTSFDEFPHTLSPPRNNGIMPLKPDCVQSQVHDSSRCGCDGFGHHDWNYHK